ncbi:MAG: carboxylesterase family protein [Clostridiales bacterium]|nr:carboxylesterase family protein [Clostridiales bacterium]
MKHSFSEAYVVVKEGILRGTVENGQKVFRGIPYAAPPIGDRRWKAPVPPAKWFGTRVVDRLVSGALQADGREHFPYEDFELSAKMDSEDCLYLNIWSPAQSPEEKLPVFVWIHGGGMIAGTGMAPLFEGEKLAEKGIIVVTINYRLGLFGFLCHPELSAESSSGTSGNYALLDMRQAVLWLRENIAVFGGDPDKITVGGQSGGSVGASCLLMSPLMKGLCHGIVMESGCPLMGGMMEPKTLNEMERDGIHFAESLDCKSIAEMRSLDGCDLINATLEKGYTPNFCVDGYFLPDTPWNLFTRGEFNDMNVLVGATSEEFGSFGPRVGTITIEPSQFENYVKTVYPQEVRDLILARYAHADSKQSLLAVLRLLSDLHFMSSARLAEACAKHGKNCYLYYKTRPDPGKRGELVGSTHSSELPYLFGRTEKCIINPEGMNDAEKEFGNQLMNYWVSFISKGNPNSDKTAVRWPKSEKLFDYLDLGKEIHIPAEDEKSILAVLNDMLLARNETSVRSYMDTTALGAPDLFRPM